jgi:hypothetical protein
MATAKAAAPRINVTWSKRRASGLASPRARGRVRILRPYALNILRILWPTCGPQSGKTDLTQNRILSARGFFIDSTCAVPELSSPMSSLSLRTRSARAGSGRARWSRCGLPSVCNRAVLKVAPAFGNRWISGSGACARKTIPGLRGIEWANLGSEGPRKLCISSDLGFRRGPRFGIRDG